MPVLVYSLTLYDDGWGSGADLFTAFAVGFAGKVALDFGGSLSLPDWLRPKSEKDKEAAAAMAAAVAAAKEKEKEKGDSAEAPSTRGANGHANPTAKMTD